MTVRIDLSLPKNRRTDVKKETVDKVVNAQGDNLNAVWKTLSPEEKDAFWGNFITVQYDKYGNIVSAESVPMKS